VSLPARPARPAALLALHGGIGLLVFVVLGTADFERAAVGRRFARLLEQRDFRDDLVERRLHGLDADCRQVREIDLRGCARNFERPGRGPHLVEGRSGRAHVGFLHVDARAQGRGGLLGNADVVTERVHVGDGAIELAQRFGGGDVERGTLFRLRGLLRSTGIEPRLQLARGFLQPDHLGCERRRALDQRGVRRSRLGHSLRRALDALARRRARAAPRRGGLPPRAGDRHRGARGTRVRFPAVQQVDLLDGRAAPVASTSFLRSSRTVRPRDRETCASNETMAFDLVQLRAAALDGLRRLV
jgi:hypothetical protein